MPPRDLLLVAVVILAWGSNFTAMKLALDELPPFLFVGLRFLILLPLLALLPRPQIPWWKIIAVGVLINMGQFAFLFAAMRADVTAGLASLLLQAQAPLTILLSALFLGERVRGIQAFGIAVAVLGLVIFGLGAGGNLTQIGLALVLCGALCWASGNLILKGLGGVAMLPLFIWASLIPPLPMFALSFAVEGPDPVATIATLSAEGWAAVIYVALISTVLGYSLWGALLARHKAADVTPFALLIPVVGIGTAAWVLGERLTAVEILGAVVIMVGLAFSVLGPRWRQTKEA
ncbi:EamA family transporter [Roseobacter sp. HKCCD9010]|uniref:EamA family transporter n=1 Tax=unclassified Roseobacter TaxID=196798 RepID=UPI001491DD79|nr:MULTISPECIES: EamA family transporter [unclassified Roseobacter]MBF9050763.1 EamA family transporter [Rhodobacterales bacterium HKCCD4356]NNV11819.1 EamA family transporter [Roseobacter sp. HKCCD7357]NNV17970.1 EamA family transporter [Roseobacter sp. HKCCD8768]NNV26061.1 EamA family transporter [Roseobacter sp. HKCCD8192]NNV31697.1 EamA family transporter [Roseobacter sp. HKCCD9061]